MRSIDKIIIHCSDSDNRRYDFDLINKDHKRKGWDMIGYNIGIDHDGIVHSLRPMNLVGAHAKGHNENSIGICLLGRHNFSHSQMSSLAGIVAILMKSFDVNPDNIIGHNQVNEHKTCPNFNVDLWKQEYLERALCRYN